MPKKRNPHYSSKKTSPSYIAIIHSARILILALVVVFAVFFIFNKLKDVLYHAEIFEVKEVVKSPSLSFIDSNFLQRLIGQNIFEIELAKVQKQLQSRYPHVDQLRIVREFPNRLYLLARTRDPIAWTRLGDETFLFDRRAIVLPVDQSISHYPEIRGIEQNRRVMIGKHFASEKVRIALDILSALEQDSYLQPYIPRVVDVAQLSQISLALESPGLPLMSNRFQVIMDGDHIFKKIKTLGILLSQGNLAPQDIKYIDLRFKEPILGKK